MATLKKKIMLFDMNISNNKDITAILIAMKEQRAINKKILKYEKNFANTLEEKLMSLIPKKEVKIHKFLNYVYDNDDKSILIKSLCIGLLRRTTSSLILNDRSSVYFEYKVLKKLGIITSLKNKDLRKTQIKDFCNKISFFWKDEIKISYYDQLHEESALWHYDLVFKFNLLKPIEYKIY